MITRILLAALALGAAVTPAAAQDYKAVADKPAVTLDPAKSYVIITAEAGGTSISMPVTLLRRPEQADIDDYLNRRREALAKAHGKWERKHAGWARDFENWSQQSKDYKAINPRPVEPVEPTDGNLAFPAIDQENMVTIGPLNRFAKGDGRSVFVHMVRPGRYAYYGPVNPLLPGVNTCMCMGTIEFEVKPGEVVNAGTIRLNFWEERSKAKAAGREVPRTEMDLPESMTTVSWDPPAAGATIDPRLAAYTIVPADLHASTRFPNYYGGQIDRLSPVPGVLAYDRDRIVDLKAGGK
jgi:hypothetical protein